MSFPEFKIPGRTLGIGKPCYVIAEMSGNHGQSLDQAIKIIEAAKEAGADAIKLQTYTADTLTIPNGNQYFQVGKGSLWEGKTLHDLYQEAHTPWEWQPQLKEIAEKLGMDLFSTPFDATSVDFLERMNVGIYKIASFEIVDIPLLRKVASTRKPVILSTGMATFDEIREALDTLMTFGCPDVALLKCTSAYPADPREMNLRTIEDLRERTGKVTGLSDHTLGTSVPIAAVALGASIIEKHFTLSRSSPGPDTAFSLEPHEFKEMVDSVRMTEQALGEVRYGVSPSEEKSLLFRKSLFVVRSVKKGEPFTASNLRPIRPGYGLHTRHFDELLGRIASQDIEGGTPMSWNLAARET